MKKIQQSILLFSLFSILGIGQVYGAHKTDLHLVTPSITCPAFITLSSNEDYTDTDITGIATAFELNEELIVEYNDIIIDLDENNEGFVRRRFNVVGSPDIFCDQTITMGFFQCKENIVVSITAGSNGNATVTKIFAQSLVENSSQNEPNLEASRDNITYGAFIEFSCEDVGIQNFFVRSTNTNGNVEVCDGIITVEDKLSPIIVSNGPVYLALNGQNTVELTVDMIEAYSYDNCSVTATLSESESVFSAVGTYTVTDPSGNTAEATLEVIVINISTLSCNSNISVSLDHNGEVVLSPDMFLEGTVPVNDNFLISVNDGPYLAAPVLNCNDISSEIVIAIYNPITGNTCWGTMMLEDKISPVPVLTTGTTVSLTAGSTVVLSPLIIDAGSYDNCGITNRTLVPNTFSAPGQYEVVLTLFDAAGNSDSGTSLVNVVTGNGPSIDCVNLSTALLSPFSGEITLFASDFIENDEDFDSFGMSTSYDGNYSESITFDCADTQIGTPLLVWVRAFAGDEFSECPVELTLIDDTPPIAIAMQSVELTLMNGTATLSSEDVDNGSYDLCGEVELSLSQYVFTTNDIGLNIDSLIVVDESGNVNSTWVEVTVIEGNNNPCNITSVLFPSNITIYDEDGLEENLSVENLQSFYGYTITQVLPYTSSICDMIYYTYTDLVLNQSNGVKIIRTYTAIDWMTNNVRTDSQIVELINDANTSLACLSPYSITIDDNGLQLFPIDVLAGVGYDFTTLELEITDEDVNIVPNNFIIPAYIGQTLRFEVTDTTTGNTCWSTILVQNQNDDCPLDLDQDVSFPLPEINIANTSTDLSQYTPENLESNFGFDDEEVNIIVTTFCAMTAVSYNDDVFNFADGNFKIVRNFTLIDWIVYQPSTNNGIWHFTQTINVGVDPSSLICDVLPHNAPVGDCDSGHSLEDDVEWPANIMIADYRITPDGLIEFSGIDIKDARPELFNTPNEYTASYLDILIELNSTTLTLARVWKATHSAYDISWNYSQTIIVDFTDFENLVTVNTSTNRAMPGVMFNNLTETNMQGTAQIEGEINTISFDDDPENGITIADLLLIQRHILGIESMDPNLYDDADANEDGNITGADIVELRKTILGITNTNGWVFNQVENLENTVLKPKAKYSAYKRGDIDDDALLPGDAPLEAASQFKIEDVLLNDGETYPIPIILDENLSLRGLKLHMKINTDLITLEDIEFPMELFGGDFHISDEDELVIIVSNPIETFEIQTGEENVVAYLNITAKMNGLANTAIQFIDEISYGVDQNFELIYMSGELADIIGTGTNSPELAAVSVYPNPTADYLRIDLSGVELTGNMTISIYNSTGQKLSTVTNTDQVDVRQLSSGNYFYKLNVGNHETIGKFMVVK